VKITIEHDVKDCRSCPFRYHHYGQGECWEECHHPQNGKDVYENILWGCQEQFKRVPDWCPIFNAKPAPHIHRFCAFSAKPMCEDCGWVEGCDQDDEPGIPAERTKDAKEKG
jgi:hypothetical protein